MEREQQSAHESSNHFCFSREECGHLKQRCVMDRLAVMVRNEQEMYDYDRFLPTQDRQHHASLHPNPVLIVDSEWRASIVKWVSCEIFDFNVIKDVEGK